MSNTWSLHRDYLCTAVAGNGQHDLWSPCNNFLQKHYHKFKPLISILLDTLFAATRSSRSVLHCIIRFLLLSWNTCDKNLLVFLSHFKNLIILPKSLIPKTCHQMTCASPIWGQCLYTIFIPCRLQLKRPSSQLRGELFPLRPHSPYPTMIIMNIIHVASAAFITVEYVNQLVEPLLIPFVRVINKVVLERPIVTRCFLLN